MIVRLVSGQMLAWRLQRFAQYLLHPFVIVHVFFSCLNLTRNSQVAIEGTYVPALHFLLIVRSGIVRH